MPATASTWTYSTRCLGPVRDHRVLWAIQIDARSDKAPLYCVTIRRPCALDEEPGEISAPCEPVAQPGCALDPYRP
jgi:hypothetical protein